MARLINANLGFRVFTAGWGDFDSHANEPTMHPTRMAELNAAVKRFFEVLSPAWVDRVTVMTFSEFGRTSWSNDGRGTDHGTAAPHFVFGARVKGGMYGQRPALQGLRRWDRMAHHVDFRDYYGSVIDGWMGGGGSDVVDKPVNDLGLFLPPGCRHAARARVCRRWSPPRHPAPVRPGCTRAIRRTEPGADLRHPRRSRRPARRDRRRGDGPRPGHRTRRCAGRCPVGGAERHVGQRHEGTYFSAFPAGLAVPDSSSLNPQPGRAIPNMVIVGIGAGGAVSIFNKVGQADCIVDVLGYFHPSDGCGLEPLVPDRLLDTRVGIGGPAGRVGAGASWSCR